MEVLIIGAFLGLITGFIAQSKGRSFWAWYFYGWMLFIVALPHILLAKDQSGKKCPRCAEFVAREAKICRYCNTEL